MKRILIVAIAAASLVAMQAMANVTLHIDAADLLDGSSVLAPQNTVGLWIVDTSGGTSLSPTLTLGENIAVGATLAGTTDLIIGANDIATSTASDGSLGLDFINGSYTPLAQNQKFGIIWLINQNLATTTAMAGQYGEFNDAAGAYSGAWTLPADGTSYMAYDMTTVSESGGVPNSLGVANLVIVPEPSSIVLVVVGLLGAFGLIRRRS
jgi:hypothetical protein